MPFYTSTCTDTCATSTTADWGNWITSSTGTASTITITDCTTSTGSVYYTQPMSQADYLRRLQRQYNAVDDWYERDQLYREAQNVRAAQNQQQAAAVRGTRLMNPSDLERERAHTQNNGNDNKARRRARLLLISQLSPEQRKQYSKDKCFTVIGGKSQTKYRIREVDHLVGNVDVLDNKGRVQYRLCAHAPLGSVPLADQLLVQKTYLELNEEYFLKTANRHAA